MAYTTPDIPADESERLAELAALDVLDTGAEESFDSLTRLAAYICGTPISLVSLVDADIRFYAGMPLKTGEGSAVGTLGVIDRVPRDRSPSSRARMGTAMASITGASSWSASWLSISTWCSNPASAVGATSPVTKAQRACALSMIHSASRVCSLALTGTTTKPAHHAPRCHFNAA